ncbi:MAG: hypothetical protein ACUVTQ_00360, partial [Desulfotomaculales bacterium]
LAEQEFRLANGETIRRKNGVAVFRYGGRVGGADVMFGESCGCRGTGATAVGWSPARPGPGIRGAP